MQSNSKNSKIKKLKKQMTQQTSFKVKRTKNELFLREKEQMLVPREKLFNRIFEGKGKKVKFNQMFSTITAYTPTGKKIEKPHTKQNMDLYNKFLLKQKERRARWETFQS